MDILCIVAIILIPTFWTLYLILNRRVPYPPPFNLYGMSLALAAAVGYFFARGRAVKEFSISPDDFDDAALMATIGGILGARLGFVLFYDIGYFIHHPLEIVGFKDGHFVGLRGLSIHGAVFGGLLMLLLWAVWKKGFPKLLPMLDAIAPVLPLSQAIGRWGNFFNRELWGWPTSVPWGLWVPPERRSYGPFSFPNSTTFHPVFLYEGTLNLIGVCVILAVERWAKKRGFYFPSFTAALWFIWYGVVRFGIEFIRVEPKVVGPLTMGQFISLIMVVAAGMYLWWGVRRQVVR